MVGESLVRGSSEMRVLNKYIPIHGICFRRCYAVPARLQSGIWVRRLSEYQVGVLISIEIPI